jgi:hypothetical protein
MIFKITHKLHIASGSATPCKIVRVDVTVVPIKLYNEIWPSETDGGHNRHSCLYSDGQYVQRRQEAVTKKDFFPPGAEVHVKTLNQPDCCATQRSLFLYFLSCILHRSKGQISGVPYQVSRSPLLPDYFPKLGNSLQSK